MTPMSKAAQLEPCPMCGGASGMQTWGDNFAVVCLKVPYCVEGRRAKSAEEAAKIWNTRTPEVLPGLPEGASIVKYTVRIGVPINPKPSDPKIIWQSPIRFVDGEGSYEQEAILAALAKLEEGK